MHTTLTKMLEMDDATLEALDMYHTWTDDAGEAEVLPGGAAMRVTGGNKEQYVALLANYILVEAVSQQVRVCASQPCVVGQGTECVKPANDAANWLVLTRPCISGASCVARWESWWPSLPA